MGLITKALLLGGVASIVKIGSDSVEKREEKKHQHQLALQQQQQQGYGAPNQGPYDGRQYNQQQSPSQGNRNEQPPSYQQQPYYPGQQQAASQGRRSFQEPSMAQQQQRPSSWSDAKN